MQKNDLKIILVGSIGTLVEWAEYAFYGYMAIHMAKLFFPQEDTRTGILAAFAVFAAGFLMRPIGAIFVSHIADRRGRKNALLFSMLVMGFATFGIGVLPTYQTIGIWAPLLLILCRLGQGVAIASECLGASIFLIEHARSKPYLAGSWPGTAAALGTTIGGAAALWVEHSQYTHAWRVPFILGAISCFIGLYLRQAIDESPLFKMAEKRQQLVSFPLKKASFNYWSSMIRGAVIGIFVATFIYVGNFYFSSYLVQIGQMPMKDALYVTTLGELMVVILFPMGALLAEKWGGERVMKIGLFFFIILMPVLFLLAATGHFWLSLLAQLIYAVLDSVITAPMFKWLYDLFPTQLRVTGISVSWNIAVALLGGTSPLIVQYIMTKWDWHTGPGFYLSVVGLITLIAIGFKKRGRIAANNPIWQGEI